MKFLLVILLLSFNSWALCTQGKVTPEDFIGDETALLFSGGSVGTGGSGVDSSLVVDERVFKNGYVTLAKFFTEYEDELNGVFTAHPSEVVYMINRVQIEYCYNEKLIDGNGKQRAALNSNDNGIPRIKFDVELVKNELESISHLETRAASFYVLLIHEVFNLLGLEENKPENEFLINGYKESQYISDYVIKVTHFGLGINEKVDQTSLKVLLKCVEENSDKIDKLEVYLHVNQNRKKVVNEKGDFEAPESLDVIRNHKVTLKEKIDPWSGSSYTFVEKLEGDVLSIPYEKSSIFQFGEHHGHLYKSSDVKMVVRNYGKTASFTTFAELRIQGPLDVAKDSWTNFSCKKMTLLNSTN